MAGPVYVFSTARFTEAWYRLSEQEQNDLLAKVAVNREKCGTKTVILCKSLSPEWLWFQVIEHRDIQSMQKNRELNDELGWHRCVHSANVMLGTKFEAPS